MAADYFPRRIVSLQPSATVILAAVGKVERIIACTKYCADVCPEVTRYAKTIVHDSWTASAEQIVAARPDLVIASVPYQEKAIAEILKSGARFLGLAPRTLADVYADIAMIAGAVGAAERGEQVIGEMQAQIESVREKTAGGQRPRVFCEEWGKPLIVSQPWVAELVEAAGGEFLGRPGMQIKAEEVMELRPEVIVTAWCGAGDRVPLEKIIQTRGWTTLPAAVDGRVYCIRDEFLNTPAPTLLVGLRALAAAIRPEVFPQAQGMRCIQG